MTIKSKQEYFRRSNYFIMLLTNCQSPILDEFYANYGYNRKYAIRRLNSKKRRKKKTSSGPRPKYLDKELLAVLKGLWFAID